MITPIQPEQFHDMSAEGAVVAAMFLEPKDIPAILRTVGPGDFYRPELRLIYQAVSDFNEQHGAKDIDQILIRDLMKVQGTLAEAGGAEFLNEVVNSTPGAVSWPEYAKIVLRDSKLRRMYSALSRGLNILADGYNPDEKIDEVAGIFGELESIFIQHGTRPICADTIQGKEVRWIWPNRIPIGMVSILAGEPGVGKSFLSMMMAAVVSTGSPWPDAPGPDRGGTLIITGEEDPDYSIIPRLESNGADKSRVFILEPQDLDLSEGVGRLRGIIRQVADCRLCVIDPVTCFMGDTDQNKNSDVRRTMGNLKRLAEDTEMAIILISHFTKKVDLGTVNRILGSVGFVAAARSVWAVVWDHDDPDHENRILVPCKSNYCIHPTAMRFTITDGKVVFDPEPFDHDPDEAEPENRIGAPKTDEAVEFLQAVLTGKVSVAQEEIQRLAEVRGIKYRTVLRAKKKLPIKSEGHGFGKDKQWFWSLEDIQRE